MSPTVGEFPTIQARRFDSSSAYQEPYRRACILSAITSGGENQVEDS